MGKTREKRIFKEEEAEFSFLKDEAVKLNLDSPSWKKRWPNFFACLWPNGLSFTFAENGDKDVKVYAAADGFDF